MNMAYKKYLFSPIGILVMLNTVLALVVLGRDISLASYLGTTYQADALLLAYFLPDTIGSNLFAAAMGVACVPIFSRLYLEESKRRFSKAIFNMTALVVLSSGILWYLFWNLRYLIIGILGSGLQPHAQVLTIEIYTLLLPLILVIPLFAIGSAVLQANERFAIPALATIFFNIVYLVGIQLCIIQGIPIDKGVYQVATAILSGVLVMFLLVWLTIMLQCWFQKKNHFEPLKLVKFPADERADILNIIVVFLPYLLILVTNQSVLYVERNLASGLQTGTIAGLNYAYRLAQFPLWVFVSAVVTVLLPTLSKSIQKKEHTESGETFKKAVLLVYSISIPMTVIFFILAEPIVTIMLQRGAFDHTSLAITTGILRGYSLAILGQSLVLVTLRFFLAIEKLFLPLLCTMIAAIINVVLDYYLVSKIGSAGLGYGAAIGWLINAIFTYILINREESFNWDKKDPVYRKILYANVPLIFLNISLLYVWKLLNPSINVLVTLSYIGLVVLTNTVVFLGGVYILKPFK